MWARANTRDLFDVLLFVRETSAAHHNPAAPYLSEFVREDPPDPRGFVNLDFSAGTEGWRPHAQPAIGSHQIRVVGSKQSDKILEIFRAEPLYPYDVFAISQTASAAPWRGKKVTVRCSLSIRSGSDGSSAQLAMRVLAKRPAALGRHDISGKWSSRFVWQRVACCDEVAREVCVTELVDNSADTFSVALIVTGNGCARFGPITISEEQTLPG